MLEDDGRVDEQIFNEYTALSLRYPPRFTQVTTEEEALAELKNRNFELIICMGGVSPDEIQRKFTDLQGWVNQYIASKANEVFLMVSGIPLKVK